MAAFLVLHDLTPEPWPTRAGGRHLLGARALAAAVVRVTAVPGGVRVTCAPADGRSRVDAFVTALAGVVERERREGSFLRFTVEVTPDGGAVSLTITGPPVPARVTGPRLAESRTPRGPAACEGPAHGADGCDPAPVVVDATHGVTVNGANVVSADIKASNGVIHVVDAVLTPPASK